MLRHTNGLVFSLLALLAAGTWCNFAVGQTNLRWKFKPGKEMKYVMEQDMKMAMSTGERTIETKSKHTLHMAWKVLKVDADGNAHMQQQIDRMQFHMHVPGLDAVKYDSDNEKATAGVLARQLAPLLEAMVKVPFTVTMAPNGKFTNLKLPETLAETLKSQPELAVGPLFSEEGLAQLMTQGSITFPAEPVSPGAKWNTDVEMKVPKLGTQKVTTTYTYKGPAIHAEKKAEKIDTVAKVSIAPDDGAAAQVAVKEQESSGAVFFDNVAGRMAESNLSMKMTMHVSVGEVTIVQKMETVTQMKLDGQ